MFEDIYILFILVSLLVSISVYFRKGQPLYLCLFPLNLATVMILEFIAVQLASAGHSNVILYIILSSAQITFYLWFFSQIVTKPSMRSFLKWAAAIYPVFVLLNKFLVQTGVKYHTITIALGSLMIALAAIYYFLELFQAEKSINLVREPAFWIASGLLFFYTCSFPLFTLINKFYSPSNKIIFYLIHLSSILNILLYSSFIIAFLCRIKIRKFSS